MKVSCYWKPTLVALMSAMIVPCNCVDGTWIQNRVIPIAPKVHVSKNEQLSAQKRYSLLLLCMCGQLIFAHEILIFPMKM